MPLLRAARNSNPRPATGGGDIKTENGIALASDIGPSGKSGNVFASASGDQISLYIVREGDSLSQIAEMFGVTVNTIMWANDLTSKKPIKEGQELIILPVTGVRHVVEKGDTLASIAKEFHGDPDEILAFNGLPKGTTLSVGDELMIPGGEITPAKAPAIASSGTGTTVGSGGKAIPGYFTHPVPGATKTQGIHGYNGVDLAASIGTVVRASASGTVIVSRSGGWNGGYGNYIVIDHPNGTQTLYAHLSQNVAWGGQEVVAGQTIGNVGNTGRSTGAHLHFEVRGAKNPF